MNNQVCIVTTLRGASKVLNAFLDHHINLGFNHIYLFFDDPHEAPDHSSHRNVTFIKNDAILKGLWRKTYSYERYRDCLDKEVAARQILNVEVARDLAIEAGIGWILHIDIDELFVLHGYENVQEHFEKIGKDGSESVIYLNHEGIAEKLDIDNYLKEVTLFKKNYQLLTESQQKYLHERYSKSNLFNYYTKGKSAGRVHKHLLPGGVHRFSCNSVIHTNSDTSILHFPCCGFENFISKYRIRGNFGDKWFGRIEIAKSLPVHIESRNIVGRNNINEAKQFYKRVFMPSCLDELKDLLDNGIYFRMKCYED